MLHDDRHHDASVEDRSNSGRSWIVLLSIFGLLLLGAYVIWHNIENSEQQTLARESRVVMRIPEDVIDKIAPNRVEEQFEIQETAAGMEVDGTSMAVGDVSVDIIPHSHSESQDIHDALITVQVSGDVKNDFVGKNKLVKIVADGNAEFEATKVIHFDGLTFDPEEETTVKATHDTEILSVEPAKDASWRGAVKILATRRAKAAIPELNEIAIDRVKEIVGDRVDTMVNETVVDLNQINRFDSTVASLHPSAERWQIGVQAQDDFLVAALVPDDAKMPQLPVSQPKAIELWLKLSRSQRASLDLADRWGMSHSLLKRQLPEEHSNLLPPEMKISTIEDWTRFQVGLKEEPLVTLRTESPNTNRPARTQTVIPIISVTPDFAQPVKID